MRDEVYKNGHEYYEYVLLYFDDCSVIGENATEQIHQIDIYFPMKPSSIDPPSIYLGAKIGNMELNDETRSYYFNMLQCIKEAVKNVEIYLKEKKLALLKIPQSHSLRII